MERAIWATNISENIASRQIFSPIQDLWENVIENIKISFFPHCEITIDEQLFPCRCAFIHVEYMPQKPSKFGIKFWLPSDVMTSYGLKAIPYLSKEDRPGDIGVAEHVVRTLVEPYLKTGLK